MSRYLREEMKKKETKSNWRGKQVLNVWHSRFHGHGLSGLIENFAFLTNREKCNYTGQEGGTSTARKIKVRRKWNVKYFFARNAPWSHIRPTGNAMMMTSLKSTRGALAELLKEPFVLWKWAGTANKCIGNILLRFQSKSGVSL